MPKPKPLSIEQIRAAQANTKSNMAAARYLHVSYQHYKRYAKLYNLFENHKNQSGKGIPKFLKAKGKEPALLDIIEGRISAAHFSPNKIKYRLIEEGYLLEQCSMCGFQERRVLDYKMPLLLHFKDNNKSNYSKVTRSYPAVKNIYKNFCHGNMPPHTGSFYKREIFQELGYYNSDFKIAGDFDHLLRIVYIKKVKFELLNFVVVRMKSDSLSGKNLKSFMIINKEIIKSFNLNKLHTNIFKIMLRVPPKIFQYIFLNQKVLNKDFKFQINKYYEDFYYNKINVITKIKTLNLKKNFILSALNLAFLGSLTEGKIKLSKNFINWPDGIFSILREKKLFKIPGRKILHDLHLDKRYIERIIVLGNLSRNSKLYLKSKFKIKILHQNLPFGDVSEITRNLKINIKKKDLVFLTLPTPKQEQIAEYLKNMNKYYKIICIGGSIGIASGDEQEVPKFLIYFEFLWRLRYETFRRLKRLIVTFYVYMYDIIFKKNIRYIKIKILN